MVRTNLTILLKKNYSDLPEFFRDHAVRLIASMPCYLEENVDRQRGRGVYEESIEALRRLNALGYGIEERLPLHLIYNPGGAQLPPPQAGLEADYRRELRARFGIEFTGLFTITNMPIGRFFDDLHAEGKGDEYQEALERAFNPETVERLMCRTQISIRWDGVLHDCDFNLALRLSIDPSLPTHIRDFDPGVHAKRPIVTDNHCFGCTAGAGSSCGGALAESELGMERG